MYIFSASYFTGIIYYKYVYTALLLVWWKYPADSVKPF
jgi:hypothetical protein